MNTETNIPKTMLKNKEFILLVLNMIIDASNVINPYKKGDEKIFSKCIIISLEEYPNFS